MNRTQQKWLALFCMLAALVLAGCSADVEQRIGKNFQQLLSSPDEYLQENRESIFSLESSFDIGYQPYLETAFAKEDFTEPFYEQLALFRLNSLLYPQLYGDSDIQVRIEDVRVQLEREEARMYVVEAQAVLKLGDATETMPISSRVQLDEKGRISYVEVSQSIMDVTARCLQFAN